MANQVGDLIERVLRRIKDPKGELYLEALQSMNWLYQQLNAQYYPIKGEFTFSDVTFDWTEDENLGWYATLPTDCIEVFRIREIVTGNEVDGTDKNFYPIQDFKRNVQHSFSMDGRTIYFGRLDGDEEIRIWFYSRGLELVDAADGDFDAFTETNTPEYDVDIFQILFFGTATQLKNDYPMYKSDLVEKDKIEAIMSRRRHHTTSVNPRYHGTPPVRAKVWENLLDG